MKIRKFIIVYLLTALLFFAIDMLWLGIISKPFYDSNLPNYMATQINWIAAFLFYIMYLFGIFFFAVKPSLENQSVKKALLNGGLFGFFTYGTYDFTNLATLADWPIIVVIVDILWGIFITSLTSYIGYSFSKKINL